MGWRSVARVVASLLVLRASLVWLDRIGAGWVAENLLTIIPRKVDLALGEKIAFIFVKEFAATQLPAERTEAIRQRFLAAAASQRPDLSPLRLDFYRGALKDSQPGFNAFVLPNGQIIVFDGLAVLLTEDGMMVVLGHELGHLA